MCELSQHYNYIYDCIVEMANNNMDYYKINKENIVCSYMFVHYVCECSTTELLDLLYNNDTDLNSKTDDGMSCIMIACMHNNLEIVEYLLNKDVDLIHKDIDDETILHNTGGIANRNINLYKKIVEKYCEQLEAKNSCSE